MENLHYWASIILGVLTLGFVAYTPCLSFFKKKINKWWSVRLCKKLEPLLNKVELIPRFVYKRGEQSEHRDNSYTISDYDKWLLERFLTKPSEGKYSDINENAGRETYKIDERLWKRYSGCCSVSFYDFEGVYQESHLISFGGPKKKPERGGDTWVGNVIGYERTTRLKIKGKIYLKYDFCNNRINMVIFHLLDQKYFKKLDERNILVTNDDGSFDWADMGNIYQRIDGCFYGDSSEETTGLFEDGDIVGAWFAKRVNK